MWIPYQIATALALLLAGPYLLLRRGRHYLESLPGRLGRRPPPVPPLPLWIHAVSVGEAGVAATLARALPPELPLLVTTITPTGQSRARESLGERAVVAYLPFELGFAVRRFLRHFSPRALVLVEGDLWPLVLRHAKRRGMPIMVVNGRVSEASYRRMSRLRPLLGPLLKPVDLFAVQTAEDRRRLLALGVEPERVVTTGNLKFDTPTPESSPKLVARLQELADGRPIFLAGSTMKGEEEKVLQAFAAVGGERALLILAPRHPERWNEVERLLLVRRLRAVRRSRLDAVHERPEVVLLDSLGELAALYRIGRAAFIGGTLVATGGHNPLEPASFGRANAPGPSMENFREIAAMFDRAGAWRRVASAEELGAVWSDWARDASAAEAVGGRAARLLAESRGALARTLTLVESLLAASGPPPAAAEVR